MSAACTAACAPLPENVGDRERHTIVVKMVDVDDVATDEFFGELVNENRVRYLWYSRCPHAQKDVRSALARRSHVAISIEHMPTEDVPVGAESSISTRVAMPGEIEAPLAHHQIRLLDC